MTTTLVWAGGGDLSVPSGTTGCSITELLGGGEHVNVNGWSYTPGGQLIVPAGVNVKIAVHTQINPGDPRNFSVFVRDHTLGINRPVSRGTVAGQGDIRSGFVHYGKRTSGNELKLGLVVAISAASDFDITLDITTYSGNWTTTGS